MKTIFFMLAFLINTGVIAQTVGDFQLKDTDNTLHSYESLKGENLTVIDFWASWCKPCMKAMPELNKIYDTFKEKGVQVIGINCDGPRSIAKVEPLTKSLQIKYPVLLDMDTEVMNDLNLQAYPTLILVNKDNEIVWVHEGFVSGDAEIITAEIEKQLGNR